MTRWLAALGVVALTCFALVSGQKPANTPPRGRRIAAPAFARAGVPGVHLTDRDPHRSSQLWVVQLPAVLNSTLLTTGNAGAGQGSSWLDVLCSDGQLPPCTINPGDQEDDRIIFFASDVRCWQTGTGCASPGADYVGVLLVRMGLRITDHSGASQPPAAPCPNPTASPPCLTVTVEDFAFSVPVQCVDNGGANGAVCSLTTTMDEDGARNRERASTPSRGSALVRGHRRRA